MIVVSNFTKKDAQAVSRLIPQLTRNIVDGLNLDNRMNQIIDCPGTRGIIATVDGKLAGYAQLAWYIIPSKGLIAWVEEVVVDEKVRGQGVGRALMEKLLKIAEELGCQQVKLTSPNFIAQKLYESLGFTFKETEVMVKNL
ncbi:MAG: hypothetical protein COT81_02635 [Candidatus Buchananbacteria bacterium CG10_big_fil_rev_8_21_14_0_10_42_9]|uniref:N-acetyltransferase domain-containing protein n=1 Tax=Candidatus Buchananbacteria bacterium CG10_big_fil_rev_8_21_14_0_10_42_9 TaxID=1974526 RepID=A0A2H0W1A5_9BACT|nr:MAG: hypothetical protein COT81_02635 [Candidatus Buchananbacteria bacterium CG10_big_fil_rev_8_21_14_0_10_42_9]